MIGDLSFGPDGLLWGVVDGTIFALNPDTREVVKSKKIRPSLYNSTKWRSYYLRWAPDGMLYTTLSRKLFAIDPQTLQTKQLADGLVNNMTVGLDGSIYYALENQLYRIAVPQTDATLKSISIGGAPLSDFSPGTMAYTVQTAARPAVTAVASQSGSRVMITEETNRTLVQVTAPDGRSTLAYSIRWETIEQEPLTLHVEFTNDRGEQLTAWKPGELLTARMQAENRQARGQEALLIVAQYDEAGAMTSVSYLAKTIAPGQTEQLAAGFRLPDSGRGGVVKAFVWEGKDLAQTSMKPLSPVYNLPAAGGGK